MTPVKQTFITLQVITQFFIELIILMGIGYFGGNQLDKALFEEKHLFVFLFLFLGLGISVSNFIKSIFRLMGGNKDATKESKHD